MPSTVKSSWENLDIPSVSNYTHAPFQGCQCSLKQKIMSKPKLLIDINNTMLKPHSTGSSFTPKAAIIIVYQLTTSAFPSNAPLISLLRICLDLLFIVLSGSPAQRRAESSSIHPTAHSSLPI